ncbi:hypothetical protein PR003_g34816, partial [Phytophthora rubi]
EAAGDEGLADVDDDAGIREASLPSTDSPPGDPRAAEGEGGVTEACWSPEEPPARCAAVAAALARRSTDARPSRLEGGSCDAAAPSVDDRGDESRLRFDGDDADEGDAGGLERGTTGVEETSVGGSSGLDDSDDDVWGVETQQRPVNLISRDARRR